MGKLQRYIAKEVLVSWLAVTFVLVIVLMTHRMVQLLNHVARGDFSGEVVFTLLGLKALAFLPIILPFTLFLALLLSLGRLSRDNELTVIFCCGVSPGYIYKALLSFALPLMIAVGVMTLWVSPWAELQAWKVRSIAEQEGPLATIEPGRFVELNNQRLVLYVGEIEEETRRMKQVFVHQKPVRENEEDIIISARSAVLTDLRDDMVRYVEFQDGVRYEGTPGNPEWQYIEFKKHGLKLESVSELKLTDNIAFKSSNTLWNMDSLNAKAELHWRLAMPVMVLLLTIISLPLGHAGPREGRFGRLLYGVIGYLFYLNALVLGRKIIEDGKIPAVIGMWWIHIIVIVAAIWLFRRAYGVRRHIKSQVRAAV